MEKILKPFLWFALALLFLYFVYPTRYIYLEARLGEAPVRIDRLTGEPQFLTVYGWRATSKKSVDDPTKE